MTKVIIDGDCGNSPKNIFLQKLTVAFAKADVKFLLGSVTDDIRWDIVGSRVVQGKGNFAEALKGMNKALQLTVRHIATHGKAGAVDGTITIQNGKTFAFCDVYEFKDAKGTSVKEITTYVIEIK